MATQVVAPLTGRLDMALSNYVKGYRQNDLVTDILFPRLPVMRQADRYWIFGRESQQLTEKTLRAPGTPAQETRFALSTGYYFCPSRALKSVIPDEDRANYTVGDLNMESAALNQSKILLDREVRAYALVSNPANYAAANSLALSGNAQWDNYSTSTPSVPLQNVEKAKSVIRLAGVNPNLLILSDDVFTALRNHPSLIQRFQYVTVTSGLSAQQMAVVFGVDQVIVASAVTFNGAVGGFVWQNIAILAYVAPTIGAAGVLTGSEGSIGPKDISFGKSFTWTGAPGTVDGYGVVVARHPDPTAKSDIVGVDWYSTEQITAADTGYLFTNVLGTP